MGMMNCGNRTREEMLEFALQMFLDRMVKFGEWDDGCFYYNRTSASELQEPIELAEGLL